MFYQISEKDLAKWGGASLLNEAKQTVARGDVLRAEFAAPWAKGSLRYAGRELNSSFRLISNGMIDSHCPCAVNKRDGRVCVHVVALGYFLRLEALSPERRKMREAEERHARAIHEAEQSGEFIRRASIEKGGIPAEIRVRLPPDWVEQFRNGRIAVECSAVMGGAATPIDKIAKNTALALSRADEAILFVLEDICEGRPPHEIEMTKADFMSLLELYRSRNRSLFRSGSGPLTVSENPIDITVSLDLDMSTGELELACVLPENAGMAAGACEIIAHGRKGWAVCGDKLRPLEKSLQDPYQLVYSGSLVVPRNDMVRFLRQDLPMLAASGLLRTEVEFGMFSFAPAKPEFSLRVRGTPASMAATLFVSYDGGRALPAGAAHPEGDFGAPDETDSLRYSVRDPEAESAAIRRLNEMGFAGPNGVAFEPVAGERHVLNMLGSGIPSLRRLGWKVSVEGSLGEFSESLNMAIPVVRIESGSKTAASSGVDWFEVGLDVQTPEGASIAPADVQRAINTNESFIKRGNEILLLDTDSIEALRSVFRDCSTGEGRERGTFRMDAVYAPYVQTSLDVLDGVDVESAAGWRRTASSLNRQEKLEPVVLREALEDTLRPYQKEGVSWLRFMEANGVSGILADEMGLGKTLQTLVWLELKRSDPALAGSPALVVCPTSLVENWCREAAQFTPEMRSIAMTGAHRHDNWDALREHDLVVTSYALLRRDIAQYSRIPFACMILDEAQHIKNRSTQNAIAAKAVSARNRLVLTGTPIENGVADLWSIMDFLMPGYLGDYQGFREAYEKPMAQPGEPEAREAQNRLQRKLHPFLLRRRKQEVARDLPEKLVKVSYCALSPDQRVAYDTLLNSSRAMIGDMVAERGFERSRMEILAILMRLRQVCCHLALLKDEDLLAKAERPSAKTEQFLDILDEAIDGGHRMLVFSQFTSMLKLLRDELEERSLRYSYLDGSTKNRLEICRDFNKDSGIPVFLISLKAGGTGLNLTGADMVVHFDPWWNPAVEDQATDRAHRIGQKRTVYSIKLITEGTIEEKVLELQRRKQSVIGSIVEGDRQTMNKLTFEDIRELLGTP